MANQRPRPKDSPLNPFHFLAVAMQDISIIQTGAEPVFKRIFNLRKISRPETGRGQTLTSIDHELNSHSPRQGLKQSLWEVFKNLTLAAEGDITILRWNFGHSLPLTAGKVLQ